MSSPFWDDITDEGYEGEVYSTRAWDLVILGDDKVPGICKVRATPSHKVDTQKAAGRDGAALVERGYTPAAVDIEVTLWTPGQWEAWQKLLPKIWRRPGKLDYNDQKKKAGASSAQVEVTRKAAIPIVYPGMSDLGLNSVIIYSVSTPEESSSIPGARVIKLKAIHYVAPPPPTTKATRRAEGVKAPTRDPRLDLQPTKNRPPAPSKTDAGPNGPPTAPAQGDF
jgi:hypothetical protein